MNQLIQGLCRPYLMLLKNDRLCYVILAGIVICFVLAEMAEILQHEEIYNGFDNTVSRQIIPNCSWESFPYNRGQVNWYLVCASYMAFGNARIIPAMISFGIIPMTFLVARKLGNNVVALVTTLALVFTTTFLIFDTTAAFAQTWSLLFLGSIYFARKKPYCCVPLYMAAVFSKSIPIIWLPVILYMILTSNHDRREKVFTSAALCCFAVAMSVYIAYSVTVVISLPNLAYMEQGISITLGAFRWSEAILFMLPFIVTVHIAFQKRLGLKREPVLLAIYSVGSIFFISVFTTGNYFPYRVIPNLIIMLYCYASLFHDMANQMLPRCGKIK